MERRKDSVINRVLVIDDDAELCKLITRFMSREGFQIDTAKNGALGVERALSGDYELIVLDVMMPGMNGFEVLRRVRSESRTPVLMLTAKGDELDRILGLEMGADDYLPKPFNPQELAARIRAILRRTKHDAAPAGQPNISVGDVELDMGARTLRRKNENIDLTTVEFDLLAALLRTAGRVVSREDLSSNVLGREFSPYDRSIDTHICNLRKKLGLLEDGTERIKGVRGAGYLYATPSRTRTSDK